MNTIYLKTVKAELEGAKLPDELKRVLSILDGRTGSEDLAKRAAPSLRKTWSRLLSELVKGGYIVPDKRPNIEAKVGSTPKSQAGVSASDPDFQKKMHAVEQMIAVLAAAEKVEREKSAIEIERMIAILQAADGAGTTKSDTGATSKSDIQQQAESAASIAELKSYFAAEKEKAQADIKQAEMQAAALARKKSETKAKPSAGEKNREREADAALPNLRRSSTPPKPGRT